jgi:hypothetical protein
MSLPKEPSCGDHGDAPDPLCDVCEAVADVRAQQKERLALLGSQELLEELLGAKRAGYMALLRVAEVLRRMERQEKPTEAEDFRAMVSLHPMLGWTVSVFTPLWSGITEAEARLRAGKFNEHFGVKRPR